MKNILALIAHPDDLEIMAGGSIAKWIAEGKKVHTLTFTHGSWTSPEGHIVRSKEAAHNEELNVSQFMGYSVENLGEETLALSFSDAYVIEVLKRISLYSIDTIVCPSENDLNHDHEVVARIAFAASRRVPNLLMGQINFYLRNFFVPNIYVDISETWDKKIQAMELYEGEWSKSGKDWYEFLDATSSYYGKIIGVKRAEGFYSPKYKL